MTVLAACKILNPFTQFEHELINFGNRLYLTVSTSTHSYFQLPAQWLNSNITTLYGNLGYVVYWQNILTIAVLSRYILYVFYIISFYILSF